MGTMDMQESPCIQIRKKTTCEGGLFLCFLGVMRPYLHDTTTSDGQNVADRAVFPCSNAVHTCLVSSHNAGKTLSTPQTGLLAPHSGTLDVIHDERGGHSECYEKGNHSRTLELRMCSRYITT